MTFLLMVMMAMAKKRAVKWWVMSLGRHVEASRVRIWPLWIFSCMFMFKLRFSLAVIISKSWKHRIGEAEIVATWNNESLLMDREFPDWSHQTSWMRKNVCFSRLEIKRFKNGSHTLQIKQKKLDERKRCSLISVSHAAQCINQTGVITLQIRNKYGANEVQMRYKYGAFILQVKKNRW